MPWFLHYTLASVKDRTTRDLGRSEPRIMQLGPTEPVVIANDLDHYKVIAGLGLVEKAAGIAAVYARRWDEAEKHFENALRQSEELWHRVEQPEVRRRYARLFGERKDTRTLLGEALAIYEELGMPNYVKMIQAMC